MRNPTKEEILKYRRELAHILRTMTYEDGSRVLTDESVTEYAYGYNDKSIIEFMKYNTPQELADMITM